MNGYQMAQQLKHVLSTVTWPNGSVVFGSRAVSIIAGTPNEEQIPAGFPWAMVSIDQGTADEDHPTYIEQPFTIITAAEVAGDSMGEFALIGGPSADLGKSANRGSLEIAERVHYALGSLTGADGAPIIVSLSSAGSPQPLGRGRHMVLHQHDVRALVTTARYYSAPVYTRAGGLGLQWDAAHCRARFDYLHTKVVVKVGGYPANVTDGTVVYTGDADTCAVPAGYAVVFVGYDSRKTGTAEAYSEPIVGARNP